MNEDSSRTGDGRVEELRAKLLRSLTGLHELFGKGLISRELLSGQIMELIGSRDSRRFWELTVKADVTARRFLARLEDPARWRMESSLPSEERFDLFKERLSETLLAGNVVNAVTLETLLDLAGLPHFTSFVPTIDDGPRLERQGVELSVLD